MPCHRPYRRWVCVHARISGQCIADTVRPDHNSTPIRGIAAGGRTGGSRQAHLSPREAATRPEPSLELAWQARRACLPLRACCADGQHRIRGMPHLADPWPRRMGLEHWREPVSRRPGRPLCRRHSRGNGAGRPLGVAGTRLRMALKAPYSKRGAKMRRPVSIPRTRLSRDSRATAVNGWDAAAGPVPRARSGVYAHA
jgi:hypothetical protein